ncbi:NAD(P)-binding protein [Xylariaceae sp. FL0804]|nr:NAD(P)-binding protein [Xylariaceae sp. FL0804]
MAAIFKKSNTAVITGGASGIGLALAKKCVGRGMSVLLADRDRDRVEAAAAELGENAAAVHMDVARMDEWDGLKKEVERRFGGHIDLLALNAGAAPPPSPLVAAPSGGSSSGAAPAPASDMAAAFRTAMDVNVFGVVHGVAALVPLLAGVATAARPAAVVVTGSKQGITNPPGNPAYNASKAAVRALAEHLSFDMARANPHVGVHLLVPGWTWTNLAGAASGRDKPAAAWWPEQVADYLEARMAEGRFWVLCPDNDVSEAVDRRRMLWTAGDAVEGRPPLSRWRDEFKDEFAAWMAKD